MEDQEEKLLRNRVELAVRATTRINKCDPLSCCRFWWFWWLLYWFAVSVLAIDYMLGVPYIHVQNYSPNALLQKKLGTASSTPVMIAAESVQKTSVMVADEKFKAGVSGDSVVEMARAVSDWSRTLDAGDKSFTVKKALAESEWARTAETSDKCFDEKKTRSRSKWVKSLKAKTGKILCQIEVTLEKILCSVDPHPELRLCPEVRTVALHNDFFIEDCPWFIDNPYRCTLPSVSYAAEEVYLEVGENGEGTQQRIKLY